MNKRAIFVALILSLLVSVVLWKKISKPKEEGDAIIRVAPTVTKDLVVSKRRIAARTRLEAPILAESFELKAVVASDAAQFPNAFVNVASLANRSTGVAIFPGDVMTPERLIDDNAILGLAPTIPRGKRAISIQVSKVSGVGGFIQQGDFVDIIASFRPKEGDPVSKIVLQDILILAVGGFYQFDNNTASITPAIAAGKADLVTLAVTPDELERIMFLESGVTFRLVLKNPADKNQNVKTDGATEKQVLKGLGLLKEPEPVAPPPSTPFVTAENNPDDFQPGPPVKENPVAEPVAEPVPEDAGSVEVRYGSGKRIDLPREKASPIEAPKPTAVHTELPAPKKSEPDIANPAGN